MLKDANLQILEKNNEAVYALFFEHKFLSKPQVAKLSGLSMPTVMSHIKKLEKQGLIARSKVISSDVGRPAVAYSLVADAKAALGIEIVSEGITCSVFDLTAKMTFSKKYALQCTASAAYLDQLTAVIEDFISQASLDKQRIAGIGISVQAVVDRQGQEIIYSKILPLKRLDVDLLSARIGVPCRLFHDVECAAINELWFSSTLSDAIFISISEHLGGCLIKDHKIERGKCGYAGALEHLQIHDGGRQCYCGKTGCLEAYCSLSALQQDCGLKPYEFFTKLRSGDQQAQACWNDYMHNLASALYSVYLLLERDIVLGGALARYLKDEDIQRIEQILAQRSSFEIHGHFISAAHAGNHADSAGAALYYLAEYLPADLVKVSF